MNPNPFSTLKGKKVLVTGAGGFIGSHLTERLVEEGARVRAFLRYTSRAEIGALSFVAPDLLKDVELFFGDLKDLHAVMEALKGQEIVFHLGAVISVPYSFEHPVEVIETNTLGTLNLFQAARGKALQVVVHLSTSEVYGTAQYVPIDERHPRNAQSPYAASKVGADEIARAFHYAYEIPLVILRPFNTFGPRQSQRAVITTITVQALKEKEIELGFVESVRDFVYITDTVSGIMKAAVSEKAFGEEIQIATGVGHRVEEVARQILSILQVGKPIRVVKERMRPGKSEVLRLIGSPRKAKELLDWQPEVSFEEALKETVEWIKGHIDFYERETL